MQNKILSFHADIKAVSEPTQTRARISGYGSIFGNVDSYGDIVERGAFSKSIEKRKPKMLWQHDGDDVIGVWDVVREDEKGLYLEGEINLEVSLGREAYALLKQGALDGLSIGYGTRESMSDVQGGEAVRKLIELELYEVSLVTFPANERATITSVKADDIKTEREFEKFLREAGFSKNRAKAIVSSGFKAKEDGRDAQLQEVTEGLKNLLKSIEECNLNGRNQNTGGRP